MATYESIKYKISGTAITGVLQTANNLSDVPTDATARTNIGVAIGSDVQAFISATAGTNANGNQIREYVENGGGMTWADVQASNPHIETPILWDGATVDGDGNPVGSGSPDANLMMYMNGYGNTLGWALAPNELHVYDASFVKLREVALTYQVPTSQLGDLPVAGVDVSLIGRNLAILYKNTPYSDPEAGLSAGNVQGYQSGAYPTLREVGLNLRVKF